MQLDVILTRNRIATSALWSRDNWRFNEHGNGKREFSLYPCFLEREIKEHRRHYLLEEQPFFVGGGEKMRNASGHQCKVNMSGSEEKKWARKRTTVFSMKRVIKKFLEVSRCSHARQRQRNVQKQCAARAKFFFAYYTYCCFSPFSCVASAA